MFAKPQAEHQWLERLTGEWRFVHECQTGPDQPPQRSEGQMSGRMLGGLWLLLEGSGQTPEGDAWMSQFTLGFDTASKRFVGTFVASMISHLWIYQGNLTDDGRELVLEVEGPRMDGPGTALYRDTFESVDADHWVLKSEISGTDGQWISFMTGHHHRVTSSDPSDR